MRFGGKFLAAARRYDQIFWILAYSALLIKVCVKVMAEATGVNWGNFADADLAFLLIAVICAYSILYLLARRFSRLLALPSSFIFLTLPFLFYFVFLLNSLLFNLSVRFVLWVSIGSIFLLTLFIKPSPEEKTTDPMDQKDAWGIGLLMFVIVFHGVLLFLGANFRPDRIPFADEGSFWFVAAKEMLEKGALVAHQGGYAGGGLHPFGIPFLNAFPGLLLNISSNAIIFFMPVYILFGFTIFLSEFFFFQRVKWGTLFFLTAWFAVFNNKSWAGSLFYSMVYGESVCIVFVLSLLSWLATPKPRTTNNSCLMASFAIGLLSLTKFPLILLLPAFFAVFSLSDRNWARQFGRSALTIALFLLPFFVFKLFQSQYGGQINSLGPVGLDRLFAPNVDMLRRVVQNIASDADNLFYYSVISVISAGIFYKKLWYGWPVLIWIFFLAFYYGYIHCYGSVGDGDAASGLRYYLPAASGLLLLGSLGAERMIGWIYKRRIGLSQFSLFAIWIFFLFVKLF